MKTIRQMSFVAIYGAIIFALQTALMFLPGIELTSFLLGIAAITFSLPMSLSITFVYIFLEGIFFSFSDYWFVYLIMWPLFVTLTFLMKNKLQKHGIIFAFVLGLYGIGIGFIFAVEQALLYSLSYAVSYYINGLVIDILHFIWNFVIGICLTSPMLKLVKRCRV